MVLIDRIVAVIVSAVIILMGFTVQQRAQQTSVGSVMLYAGKKQTLELADMIEGDLGNVGFNITPDQTAITEHTVQEDGLLDSFVFWGIGRDSVGSVASQVEVRYDLVAADTARLGQEVVPLYELQRFERTGGGSWIPLGGSPPTISRFYVDLLGENNSTVDKEDARRIRVWLENLVLPESQMGEMMKNFRRLRWSITISPSNLRDYQGG